MSKSEATSVPTIGTIDDPDGGKTQFQMPGNGGSSVQSKQEPDIESRVKPQIPEIPESMRDYGALRDTSPLLPSLHIFADATVASISSSTDSIDDTRVSSEFSSDNQDVILDHSAERGN